ncbi:MAG: hypothetical protein WAU07_05665 [Microgenomates group bacterium]
MKKILPLIIVILLIAVGIYAYRSMGSEESTPQETAKKKTVENVNVIPLDERPYLFITPESDGRNITISVEVLKKDASSMEYELEYQSGSLLQGVFGALDLDPLPARSTQLLGSCSAGGACTYHEDVSGGSILTRYDGPEPYALKSDWKYFENTEDETAFSSRDAKFQIESEELADQSHIVIMNAPGFPEGLSGTVVSDPYALQTATSLSGTAELTMRAQESGSLAIMGWDGNDWQEFKGTVEDKMITAEVDLMELYIVVSQ